MKRFSFALAWALVLLCSSILNAQTGALTVVSTAPHGETATREETNEIRIVFSEPMVTLGKIPDKVAAPFVRFSPAITGTFRWSGTTVLIFMPSRPLPFSTAYDVTVDTTATAVSGRKLAKPVSFRFTTPTVRLEEVRWYRRGGTAEGRIVVLITFNQPVRAADIAAALSARFEAHPWEAPAMTPEQRAALKAADPSSVERFDAKVKETQLAAASKAPVKLQPTTDWNRRAFPESPRMVGFEVLNDVAPEAWLRLSLARTVRSAAGAATPRAAQTHTVETEKAFFVTGFTCHEQCDADRRNPMRFTTKVDVDDLAAAVSVIDAATGKPVVRKPAPKPREEEERYQESEHGLTLEDAGYEAQPPNRRYVVTARPTLKSADGQTLGYTWVGSVDNWHRFAFTSFGDGQGVWEKDGGAVLPFYSRNLQDVTQWVLPIRPADLMPAVLRARRGDVRGGLPGQGTPRKLGVTPDRIQSHGLDVAPALSGGAGVLWAAVREGTPIQRAKRGERNGNPITRGSVVQVTNLGITVKDSPQNTLIFVTRLDNGAPVPGARVSIVRTDNSTHWRGTTGTDGLVLAPSTPLRDPENYWEFSFIVIAEKDGDVAYVGSDWNEGISPWSFGTGFNLGESTPLLRGTIFTDRGVYKLGEEVHLKAILRHNAPDGVRMLPSGTPVLVSVRDAQNRVVDERTIRVTNWSSAEWTMTLPADGVLGDYTLRAILESERPKPQPRSPGMREQPTPAWDEDWRSYQKSVRASFLVAAYRRPDFRVDVTLSAVGAMAGDPIKGVVNARYLFGTPMAARPVSWKFERLGIGDVPSAITEKYSEDRWGFIAWDEEIDRVTVAGEEAKLTGAGQLPVELKTMPTGVPFVYQLEGDVEDVSRQHIANRATVVVHPAPWYVGIRRPGYFTDQKAGLSTEIITVGLDGRPVAGIPVEVELTQIQWKSVREAIGDGFYEWRTEKEEIPAGKWSITTREDPVPLNIPLKNGGYFKLRATGRGAGDRFAVAGAHFYVIGEGYTAWQRFDHQRIELVPEKQTWKPGDTARVMIQSPWETATALVTTEREGIRSQRQFALTSTMQTVSVPITEADIPNVFVSVVLVKGRTSTVAGNTSQVPDESAAEDPGKPTFRIGYVELKVEDRTKRLTLKVSANREEYRPASAANVRVEVNDHQGRGTASEVTLWAVDYGVLSLTGYRAPEVADSVYVRKALQVTNSDNRQRIISRRVLTPKGDTEGGGGGSDPGAGTLRKDFRVLAFWLGSVTTGADGRASVDVKLPESLTTYRIMAVAADRTSRFGSGSAEVRTNKPLTLKPTFPRFMAVGDRAFFGAVVGSQLKSGGTATVTMRSLDPAILEITGGAQQQIKMEPGGTIEARFEAAGKAIGRARIQMTARLGDETDAFEDVIPVEVLLTPETVAAYGEATDAGASEALTVPASAVPGFGGLTLELSSTALVGLGEGARYLVEYPYGCAEQRSSKARALMLAADLGETFELSGMNPPQMRAAAQATLRELERFQCDNGGFAFWPGACQTASPYLTAYLLQVMKTAADLKYQVTSVVRDRAYGYLEQQLASPAPGQADLRGTYYAWQAFAVKVLAEGGRNQDSHINRLYAARQRMPMFAVAFLHDALTAKGESGARVTELRRIMLNAILPEAGTARVEDFSDPYLLWFWHSNTRTTAIVLNTLVKGGVTEAPIRQLVRGLMTDRKNGRWGNTQENAYAMEALVNYYRRFEPETPAFRALVKLGEQELARGDFQGRSTQATTKQVPLTQISAKPGATAPLTFAREGTGTLFYTARLRYAVDQAFKEGLDSGIRIERVYERYNEANATGSPMTTYQAGDLVRVRLTFHVPKERRFVAVTDPLPAGFEAVESWFNTTSDQLAKSEDQYGRRTMGSEWISWWTLGGFDHAERHDDRVQLFATRLSEGTHTYSYVARATTAGTFRTAPTHAEEMYTPEILGRTASTTIEIKR